MARCALIAGFAPPRSSGDPDSSALGKNEGLLWVRNATVGDQAARVRLDGSLNGQLQPYRTCREQPFDGAVDPPYRRRRSHGSNSCQRTRPAIRAEPMPSVKGLRDHGYVEDRATASCERATWSGCGYAIFARFAARLSPSRASPTSSSLRFRRALLRVRSIQRDRVIEIKYVQRIHAAPTIDKLAQGDDSLGGGRTRPGFASVDRFRAVDRRGARRCSNGGNEHEHGCAEKLATHDVHDDLLDQDRVEAPHSPGGICALCPGAAMPLRRNRRSYDRAAQRRMKTPARSTSRPRMANVGR